MLFNVTIYTTHKTLFSNYCSFRNSLSLSLMPFCLLSKGLFKILFTTLFFKFMFDSRLLSTKCKTLFFSLYSQLALIRDTSTMRSLVTLLSLTLLRNTSNTLSLITLPSIKLLRNASRSVSSRLKRINLLIIKINI